MVDKLTITIEELLDELYANSSSFNMFFINKDLSLEEQLIPLPTIIKID